MVRGQILDRLAERDPLVVALLMDGKLTWDAAAELIKRNYGTIQPLIRRVSLRTLAAAQGVPVSTVDKLTSFQLRDMASEIRPHLPKADDAAVLRVQVLTAELDQLLAKESALLRRRDVATDEMYLEEKGDGWRYSIAEIARAAGISTAAAARLSTPKAPRGYTNEHRDGLKVQAGTA